MSYEEFGTTLAKTRKEMGYTQTELANLVGTSRVTIQNWEKGVSYPDLKSIHALTEALKIPIGELLCFPTLPDYNENVILREYRTLNETNKQAARAVIFTLHEEQIREEDKRLKQEYVLLPLMSSPAAAGVAGYETNEIPPEPIFVKKGRWGDTADYVVRVSGASMEPRYFDGDLVFVEETSCVENGEDAILVYNEGILIKNIQGRKVISLNPKYPFKKRPEDLRIIGRVLGIVEKEADREERNALNELFHNELAEYYRN